MKRLAALFGLLLTLCGTPALAALGTPSPISAAPKANFSGESTAGVLTTNVTLNAGDFVVVLTTSETATPNFSSVTDSAGGNTWSACGTTYSTATPSNIKIACRYSILTNGIASGGTVQSNWSSATGAKFTFGWVIPGATTFDQSAGGNSGTGNSPTITTGTLAQVDSVAFSVLEEATSSTATYTESTTDAFTGVQAAVTTSHKGWSSYRINPSGTGAITYAPTLTSSPQWFVNVLVFNSGGSTAFPSRMGLQGVGR